ncbi:MAG: cbb3-type cytochrome c oxidase N-terminal domain-containing protein [Myxococcota bacterium]
MSTKPTDELLDHEYDGIREFDNPIPAWWTWMWIASIVFSAVYFVHYHVTETGTGVFAAYEAEMEDYRAVEAERRLLALKNVNEDFLTTVMKDEAAVKAGAEKFATLCASCHGKAGEGLVGPNLTDDFWLHTDGSLMSIRKVVADGVPEKGMPAWEKMMSGEELASVVAFLGTLRGTNVPGKEPQGENVKKELAHN